ncbi:DUF7557 family protein [Methanosphaerula subterraneus]|uniref:DUF7557 family protein n=1 Tax=Methanosphaerula subterraneus TaxID=3350244 RepID=UPI003F840B90
MATSQTIRLEVATKARLAGLRNHPRETFNDIVERLITMAVDDEPLSAEEEEELKEAEADIRAGNYRPLDDLLRDHGLL